MDVQLVVFFRGLVCGVVCSLVRLSVGPCGCVMAGHVPRARRRGRNDHTSDSRPRHQCVVSPSSGGSADEMCCTGKDSVVDASITLCLLPQTEMAASVHHQQLMSPVSGGGGRGDDGLGIRKL